jgi:hypothetical protein
VKPLLRKDAAWLLAFAIGGLAFASAMHAAADGPWVLPESNYAERALAFHWVAATLVGLAAALLDDLTKTREYILHRSVSRARVFWTRQLGGLLVVAAWVLLVPALHLAVSWILREDRHLIEAGRYFRLVDESTPAFVFYALGVASGAVARRLVWALPLAALTATLSLFLFVPRLISHTTGWHGLPVTLVALPVAAGFLLAASISDREGRDADRPWSRRQLLSTGLLLLALAVPACSFALGALERGSVETLFEIYPYMGHKADGTNLLYVENKWTRKFEAVSEAHETIGPIDLKAVPLYLRPKAVLHGSQPITVGSLPARGRRSGDRYTRGLLCPGETHCYLASDGLVDLVRETPVLGYHEWSRPARFRVGQAPDNRPFGSDARPMGSWWSGTAFMADPTTGTLWAADLISDEPRFVPLELPNGDRVRRDLTMDVMQAPRFRLAPPPALVVAGEHGSYSFDEQGRMVPVAPATAEIAARADKELQVEATLQRRTATEASIMVDWHDGSAPFAHVFRPQTLSEQVVALGIHVSVILKPAGFALAGLLFPVAARRDPAPAWLLQTEAQLQPTVLFVLNFGLTLLMAGLTWRRLTRFGAAPQRVWFWVGAVLLGGVPGFLCQWVIETKRAWLPAAAPAPAPALRLIIESASA